jgi:hypothetical protein
MRWNWHDSNYGFTGLVDVLRSKASYEHLRDARLDAADEIERLTRERDDAVADALRLHNEKMDFFNRVIKAESERDGYKDLADVAAIDLKNARGERDAMRAALQEVRAATCEPLPDPGAHSWRAFYDAACTRLTRCSNAARRGLRNVTVEQAAPESAPPPPSEG